MAIILSTVCVGDIFKTRTAQGLDCFLWITFIDGFNRLHGVVGILDGGVTPMWTALPNTPANSIPIWVGSVAFSRRVATGATANTFRTLLTTAAPAGAAITIVASNSSDAAGGQQQV